MSPVVVSIVFPVKSKLPTVMLVGVITVEFTLSVTVRLDKLETLKA